MVFVSMSSDAAFDRTTRYEVQYEPVEEYDAHGRITLPTLENNPDDSLSEEYWNLLHRFGGPETFNLSPSPDHTVRQTDEMNRHTDTPPPYLPRLSWRRPIWAERISADRVYRVVMPTESWTRSVASNTQTGHRSEPSEATLTDRVDDLVSPGYPFSQASVTISSCDLDEFGPAGTSRFDRSDSNVDPESDSNDPGVNPTANQYSAPQPWDSSAHTGRQSPSNVFAPIGPNLRRRRHSQNSRFPEAVDSANYAGNLLEPQARFSMNELQVCITFDPALSARYLLLKLWSTRPDENIDIQSVEVKGWAGPRWFPAEQMR